MRLRGEKMTSQKISGFSSLAESHPCLGRARNKGRLHLPVSPVCNIKCRFCSRRFNAEENRPGVANGILPAKDACGIVERALELCPEITVVGVAGPGDSLASGHALECFRAIHEQFPRLIGCMSTNGLMLPEYADEIAACGIRSVTVTVNAVRPSIISMLVDKIELNGEILTGKKAASELLTRQLWGIKSLAARDIFVKVNTVLIPEINGEHIGEVAKVVSSAGASLINIIPLIPQGEFSHMEAPDCEALREARQAAEEYLPVFRHCTHCRADACGLLGESGLENQLYQNLNCENNFSHG
jgi:nitrogen fixation protein NifB